MHVYAYTHSHGPFVSRNLSPLWNPAIILSLQTFSKNDQIALLEKSISSVIAYVPKARVFPFATNNSIRMAGHTPLTGSSFFMGGVVLPWMSNYILLSGDLITFILSILTLCYPCPQRVGQNEKGLWKYI